MGASPNPALADQSVLLSAWVDPASATGTVTFMDGKKVLATASVVSGGYAEAWVTLKPGNYSITAVYSGDAAHAGSTSAPLSLMVNKVEVPKGPQGPKNQGETNTTVTSNAMESAPTVVPTEVPAPTPTPVPPTAVPTEETLLTGEVQEGDGSGT